MLKGLRSFKIQNPFLPESATSIVAGVRIHSITLLYGGFGDTVVIPRWSGENRRVTASSYREPRSPGTVRGPAIVRVFWSGDAWLVFELLKPVL